MAPDRQRDVRMQSYQALLQQSATAKPGAALPAWRPKRDTEKAEPVKDRVKSARILEGGDGFVVGILWLLMLMLGIISS